MGALISLPFRLLNLLLPFTRSGTPLTQDLLHTAILCGTLYFAPQIAEWYNTHQHPGQAGNRAEGPEDTQQPGEEEDVAQGNDPPLDERLVLQHDGIAPVGRPPLAPTPPPHQAHIAEREEEEDAREPQNLPHPDQQQLPDDAFAPGPANANPQHPRPTPANRTIGTKKAKSLARRDQQRAYNEWIRSEAERRKLEENEGREEREASLAAEKARRLAVEESIRGKEREEREARKVIERKEADEEAERRERVVRSVREGMDRAGAVNLVDAAYAEGKDVVWVERLIRASGLLQQLQREGSHVMITGKDWLVRIDAEVMQRAYAEAEGFGESNRGKLGFEDFGTMLEKAVLARVQA